MIEILKYMIEYIDFFCLISEFKGVKTILRSILIPTLFFFIQLYFFILFLTIENAYLLLIGMNEGRRG